jgi:hypothetical protein
MYGQVKKNLLLLTMILTMTKKNTLTPHQVKRITQGVYVTNIRQPSMNEKNGKKHILALVTMTPK